MDLGHGKAVSIWRGTAEEAIGAERTLRLEGRLNFLPQMRQSYLASFQLAVSRVRMMPLPPADIDLPVGALPTERFGGRAAAGAVDDDDGGAFGTPGRSPARLGKGGLVPRAADGPPAADAGIGGMLTIGVGVGVDDDEK